MALIHLGYVDLDDRTTRTRDLLTNIMNQTKNGDRVRILVDAGRSKQAIPRVRVMLSRARAILKKSNKPYHRFRLRTEVTRYTDTITGKRYDAIYIWRERTAANQLAEHVEDMIHGKVNVAC